MNFVLAVLCFVGLAMLAMVSKPKMLVVALIPVKVILALATGAFAANTWLVQWVLGWVTDLINTIGGWVDPGLTASLLASAVLFLAALLTGIQLFILWSYTSQTEAALIAMGILALVASSQVATMVGRVTGGAETIALRTIGAWIGA